MKSIHSLLLVAAGIALACPACVVVDSEAHQSREEKRFTVSGKPELHLATFDGSIEIRSGETGAVVVDIEKRGPSQKTTDELKVDTKQNGNRIDVEVRKPQHTIVFFGIGHLWPSAKLIVTMPRDGDVVARSGDGSIRADRVNGRLELHTGDGSIHGTDVSGQLVLSSGDGSITLDSVTGDLDAQTGDGSVSASGTFTAVKLHTGDGSVTLRADSGTAMKDDWSITTGDGGVAVSLPSDFAAELDAYTGDGSIHSDLSVTIAGGSGEESRRTLRGRLGAGGKTLKIRTGDGSIRLKAS
jgi:putative adhesin